MRMVPDGSGISPYAAPVPAFPFLGAPATTNRAVLHRCDRSFRVAVLEGTRWGVERAPAGCCSHPGMSIVASSDEAADTTHFVSARIQREYRNLARTLQPWPVEDERRLTKARKP